MAPVLDLAVQTFATYADAHGYDLVVGDGSSDGRPPSWGKVLLVRRLLDTYDEVLWVDADAIILDGSVDLASQVPVGAFQAMARPKLPSGQRLLNCGVWFSRGDRAKVFLDLVWEQEQWRDHGWWEQRAVIELLHFDEEGNLLGPSPWLNGTFWLDDEWNSLDWLSGLVRCRIRHYSYRSNEFRLERMRLDLARTDGRRGAWLHDLLWRRKEVDYRRRRIRRTRVARFLRKVRVKIRYEMTRRRRPTA